MTKIVLVGGRVIDPANQVDERTNVYIADGRIVAVAPKLDDYEPTLVMDASDKIISPGLVDLHANILQSIQGLQGFATYLERATEVGITSIGTSAFLSNRCLEATEVHYLTDLSRSAQRSANVYFIGPLTENLQGACLAELKLLKEAGCIGFTNGFQPVLNTLIKRRCYDYAGMLGFKVFIVAQDSFLSPTGGMHEGEISARLGLPGIPSLAETIALAQELRLIAATGVKAHFFHLSSGQSLPILEMASHQALSISADVSIHHLYLTQDTIRLDNGMSHVQPPLRTSLDKQLLRKAIKDDRIQSIASHHTGLPLLAKEVPFQDSLPGIASWPLLLPLTLRLAKEEQIPLSQAIGSITCQPAQALGIDVGHLTPGAQADVIVFDPVEEWCLAEQGVDNFDVNNPFMHWQLCGRVKCTIVNGHIAYTSSK
jgi:dihydroorotase